MLNIITAPGMCYVTGVGHFSTFDNLGYEFYGSCQYTLVYDQVDVPSFRVVLNGDPNCDVNTPCKKSVNLIVQGKEILLGEKINGQFYVEVENKPVSLPHIKQAPKIQVVSGYIFYHLILETGPLPQYEVLFPEYF